MAVTMTAADKKFYQRAEREFEDTLKSRITKARFNEEGPVAPEDQDWSEVHKALDQYGGFLELYPKAAAFAELSIVWTGSARQKQQKG